MAGDRLQVLIQAPEDLNFLVEYTSVTTGISSSANTNPSPAGRQVTSSTSMDDDRMTLTGWVRCLSCNGNTVDITDVIPSLKRFMEAQKYTINDFATITTPHDVLQNMTLESVDVDRTYKKPQELIVSMTWRAINVSGDISNPNLSIGGVQG